MREIKKAKAIRLTEKMCEQLNIESENTGKSVNRIIEDALYKYFTEELEYEKIIDLFMERFDKKYGNALTRIRLAAGTADKNVQALLNIKNTELFTNRFDPDNFMSIYDMEHEVIKKSMDDVKRQIAIYKQRKDSNKNGDND